MHTYVEGKALRFRYPGEELFWPYLRIRDKAKVGRVWRRQE